MQYKHEIDDIIMDLIWDRFLGYNELKRAIDGKLGRKLSYETFDLHVDRLLQKKLIEKVGDTGRRGTSVQYHVTGETKRKKQLQILGYDRKQLLLRKVYEQILLFEFSRGPYILKFEQIQGLLSELGIRVKDLKISSIKRIPLDYDIEHKEIYEKHPEFITTQTIYKPIETKDIRNLLIQIWKNEHSRPALNDYCLVLPGFSKSEVLNKARFGDLKPTKTELEEAFDTLRKEHIIKPIGFKFQREMRYTVTDGSLRAMIKDLWNMHSTEWSLLYNKWDILEPPTEDEKKWLSWCWGEEEARRFFQQAEVRRHDLQKKEDMLISLTQDLVSRLEMELKQKIEDFKAKHTNTLKQYTFLRDIFSGISPLLARILGEEIV